MKNIKEHPELQNLRRWMLATKDAHGLYAQFGFEELNSPDNIMEITNPNIYLEESHMPRGGALKQ